MFAFCIAIAWSVGLAPEERCNKERKASKRKQENVLDARRSVPSS